MIVLPHISGWKIVSHYTHGLVAGKFANEVDSDIKGTSWIDVLTGIIQHDDHLLDFDEQNYLTEAGAPKDFKMDKDSSDALEHAKRLYTNAGQKSQLVALLVSRHLDFLYNTTEFRDEPIIQFLKQLKEDRKKQRKLYELTVKDVDHLYNILLFSDRCSLIVCQELIPEVGRSLEINKTIDDKTYFISENNDGTTTIKPWCFKGDSFAISYEYRILKKLTFKNNKELESALNSAEIFLQTYTFRK